MSRKLAIIIAMLILSVAMPASAAIGIGPSDLHNQLIPQNPVRTWGKVTSTSPLRISDGDAEIEVTGLSGLALGDYLWVEGDWNGSVLAASQEPQKANLYKSASRTEMVRIPAGSFQMGSPDPPAEQRPQHWVYLSEYWIGKYEVTRGEYGQFMSAGGYSDPTWWSIAGWAWKVAQGRTQPTYWSPQYGTLIQTDSHPVIGVTYYEAEAFCKWAGGHLATEAQWEKAACWTGSHANIFPWGDTYDVEKCNNPLDHNPAGGGYEKNWTAPVGSYPSGASPYGCMDMAGNVPEWVQDWYGSTYYSLTPPGGWNDPQGPSSGLFRSLRDGGWYGPYSGAALYRCAYRGNDGPYASGTWGYGFRMAR